MLVSNGMENRAEIDAINQNPNFIIDLIELEEYWALRRFTEFSLKCFNARSNFPVYFFYN